MLTWTRNQPQMMKTSMVGLGTGCRSIHSPTPKCRAPRSRKEVVPGAPQTRKNCRRVTAPPTTSNHAISWSRGSCLKKRGTTMDTSPTIPKTTP